VAAAAWRRPTWTVTSAGSPLGNAAGSPLGKASPLIATMSLFFESRRAHSPWPKRAGRVARPQAPRGCRKIIPPQPFVFNRISPQGWASIAATTWLAVYGAERGGGCDDTRASDNTPARRHNWEIQPRPAENGTILQAPQTAVSGPGSVRRISRRLNGCQRHIV
jgi:hypothetical protein